MDNKTPKRVIGIGGIFFKAENPESMRSWYAEHLGLSTEKYGTTFEWQQIDAPEKKGSTTWNPFSKTTTYFAPSQKDFMLNYCVENLEWLLEELKKEGVEIIGDMIVEDYGKFAYVLDPEGNKIELWEAKE